MKTLRLFSTFMLGFLVATSFAESSVPTTTLIVKPITITVHGKSAPSYLITQPDGTWGYVGTIGEMFNTRVINETKEPISMHWHGLILPNDQDGVPGITQAKPIQPGAYQDFHFKLVQSGTYWMHTHFGLALQQQLAAPFIIYDPQDPYKQAQNVVMFLSDFSFKSPELINQQLHHSDDMSGMKMSGMKMDMSQGPDLNDVKYNAFLTNYKTLQNPQITAVKPGSTVRLRIIDGAAASNFFINLGQLTGAVIATDGQPIKPVKGSLFSISEGQRLDIIVTIPKSDGQSYPILAQAEGTNQQTGLILTTPGAPVAKMSEIVTETAGAIDPLQDLRFHALNSLPTKPVTQKLIVTLQGNMSQYIWMINHQQWPHVTPLKVKKGDRVEITIINATAMAHPMHLHGHVFQVINVNGKVIADGPLRDTVFVPANGRVSIIFDADNTGIWMFHCHILYHSENGMMTVLQYEGTATPKLLQYHVRK